jgi:predicted Zn-ribbon and HTH transcriptional regulator
MYIYIFTMLLCIGDGKHLKALIPDPKSVIFIADYNKNYTKLAEYLNYLSYNETAYLEYRVWRKTFSYEKNSRTNTLLNTSWYCKVCDWAYNNRKLKKNEKMAHCKS